MKWIVRLQPLETVIEESDMEVIGQLEKKISEILEIATAFEKQKQRYMKKGDNGMTILLR